MDYIFLVLITSLLVRVTYIPVIVYVLVCYVGFSLTLNSNKLWSYKREVIVGDIPQGILVGVTLHVVCMYTTPIISWIILLLPVTTTVIVYSYMR